MPFDQQHSQTTLTSGLYFGQVMHARLSPRKHRFTYRVFSMFVDLDEIGALAKRSRLLGYNRFNLFSFHDKDFGEKDDELPKAWAERQLRRAGLPWDGGRIGLLCFPRILGIVFNPLSVYFCHDRQGRLVALIHEVHNTFGERHAYVLPVRADQADRGTIAQQHSKDFFVSPFIGMNAHYAFRVKPPADHVSVLIRERDDTGQEILRATLSGSYRPLSDRSFFQAFVKYPLMTLKVIVGIHWQALRLWRKGIKLHRHVPKQALERESKRRERTRTAS